MRFFFCKAQTTLCVHSRKNRRGAIKQNRLNKQNGAGRLFTAPEPSAPSGRCSEAEAGPETERCAAGESPWCSATISGLGMVVGSSPTWGAKKSVSDNRYALSFCEVATTLCVHSRKNRRGEAKQNQTHEQNGAGRLLTAPEPSAPSGRCSEAEAGPETERCAAGESPWCSATISGLGMVVGSFCTCSLSCVSSNRYALSFLQSGNDPVR